MILTADNRGSPKRMTRAVRTERVTEYNHCSMGLHNVKGAIFKVVSRQDLTEAEMTRAMEIIMNGEATEAQIGAFITALRMKGETVAEITAAAKVMRAKATRIPIS